MNAFQLTLRVLALGIFGASLIHVVFGVSSETFLGSGISSASMLDPGLDSQNRFYGAAFSLYGGALWLCGGDVKRYQRLLTITLTLFCLAGLTRLISIALVGWPPIPILVLGAIEIAGPPIMFLWLRQALDTDGQPPGPK